MLSPVGFWSYTRHDDEHTDGRLSQLRVIVGKELGLLYGDKVTLWQDVNAIDYGTDWAVEIDRTIHQTNFFLPIVTPRFLKSQYCFKEFEAFHQKMLALGRNDLVFPVHYVGVQDMHSEDTIFGSALSELRRFQWIDFRPLLFADPRSHEVRRWANDLATGIMKALRRPALTAPVSNFTRVAEENAIEQEAFDPSLAHVATNATPVMPPPQAKRAAAPPNAYVHPHLVVPVSDTKAMIQDAGQELAPGLTRRMSILGASLGTVVGVVASVTVWRSIAPADRRIETPAVKLNSAPLLLPDKQTLTTDSNADSYRLTNTLTGHSNDVISISFSPDGHALASASWDKTIKLWNSATHSLERTLIGHTDSVFAVAFSPDGRILASASWDKTIKIWDFATGSLNKTLTGHSDAVTSVAFSPDGRILASGSSDKTIKLWDAASGALHRTLVGHSNNVSSVVFSPDGSMLASGSDDQLIILWNLATGEGAKMLKGHFVAVSSVAFSRDGGILASAGGRDNTIKLWDVASGALKKTLSSYSISVFSVAFSPDGGMLAAGNADTTIKIWNCATGMLDETLIGHSAPVNSVAFSPEGNILASGSRDKTIKLWSRV